MRYSNFMFTESRDPSRDSIVLDEVLKEATLSEALGMDAIWLGEHHFDGNCIYIDPVTFSATLAAHTKRIRIGYAVAQLSLHQPMRIAEQVALIDNLSKGRLIVGLGRGTNYNMYDYEGFGIDPSEAQARAEEAEKIMLQAWTGQPFEHQGRFYQVKTPGLRPTVYTKPHPFIIRSASGEASMVEMARAQRPFLMSVQTNEVTAARMDLYKKTLRESGASDEIMARTLDQCWAWRNVYVGDTDAQAREVGEAAFISMHEQRAAMRTRLAKEKGEASGLKETAGMSNRVNPANGLVTGSVETVAKSMIELAKTGVGGVIITFRLGPMPYDVAAKSMKRFMEEVVPQVEQACAVA